MPAKYILNDQERKEFDLPPRLNSFERKRLFRNTSDVRKVTDKLRKDENKIAFILMCGYFKAGGRVFNHFYEQNWDYVRFAIKPDVSNIEKLSDKAFSRLRKILNETFDCHEFNRQEILISSVTLHQQI